MQNSYNPEFVKQVTIEHYRSIIGYVPTENAPQQAEEFEHWTDNNERVLGHICFDSEDNYFYIVVLARDENKKFKAIDFLIGLKTLETAREHLLLKIENWSKKPDDAFYNQDEIC